MLGKKENQDHSASTETFFNCKVVGTSINLKTNEEQDHSASKKAFLDSRLIRASIGLRTGGGGTGASN